MCEELNVKQVEYAKEAEKYISYQVQPNFKRLGPRVGKLMPKLKQALGAAEGGQLLRELHTKGVVHVDVDGQSIDLDQDDIEVRLQAREGWAAAQGATCVVVLSTELTDDLIREGYARDIIRQIQELRKSMNCEYTDRIQIGIVTSSDELTRSVDENRAFLQSETLAVELCQEALDDVEPVVCDVGEHQVKVYVRVVVMQICK